MTDIAEVTSVAWGPWRLSAVGAGGGFTPGRQKIPIVPTLEDLHAFENVGPSMIEDFSFPVTRATGVLDDFLVAIGAKTAYPFVTFKRGTAGGICTFVDNAKIAQGPEVPTRQAEETVRTLNFAAGDNSQYRAQSNGMLFDHTIAHAAGVTTTADGTAIQVGARSATETEKVFMGCLHSPAATVGTFDAIHESASDEAFTLNVTTEHTFTQVTSAAYEVADLTGAETNTWRRFRVTAVGGSGVYFPVMCVWKYTTP